MFRLGRRTVIGGTHVSLMMKALAAAVALSVSAGASAGSVDGATITGIGIDTDAGSIAFISISAPKSNNPACSTSTTVSFVLPLGTALANQILALLLTARASQSPVPNLTGNGLCNINGTIETLVGVTL
jgi:hypothetical protein